MKELLIYMPILLPFFAGSIVFSNKDFSRKGRHIFTLVALIINMAILFYSFKNNFHVDYHLFKFNDFIDVFLKIDNMSILFGSLASMLWICTALYSFEYMKHEGKERSFFTFFLLTLSVTIGIAFSGNLFTLYVFYELLTLSTFPLVIHTGTKEALESGKKYMIYSFTGASFVLLGMILLYSVTKDLTIVPGGLFKAGYDNSLILLISYIAMFIGFGVKGALVPFHSWLPEAMVAPTPVSSLLHAVAVVKSGIFAIIRVTFFVFGPSVVKGIGADKYIMVFVLSTILLGSIMAIHQDHLKKRLAYSTVSQLGYILLGIVMLNEKALTGALLHFINHGLIKITLFLCVGAIYYQTHKINITDIKGLGRKMPITFICLTVASISLVGIPPSNGFVSKWYLGLGALQDNNVWFVLILLLSAFITAGYLLPISINGFFKGNIKIKTDHEGMMLEQVESLEPSWLLLGPIVFLTILIIGIGLFPNYIIQFIASITETVF